MPAPLAPLHDATRIDVKGLQFTYNDAWESVNLECADEVIEFFNRELQTRPATPVTGC